MKTDHFQSCIFFLNIKFVIILLYFSFDSVLFLEIVYSVKFFSLPYFTNAAFIYLIYFLRTLISTFPPLVSQIVILNSRPSFKFYSVVLVTSFCIRMIAKLTDLKQHMLLLSASVGRCLSEA